MGIEGSNRRVKAWAEGGGRRDRGGRVGESTWAGVGWEGREGPGEGRGTGGARGGQKVGRAVEGNAEAIQSPKQCVLRGPLTPSALRHSLLSAAVSWLTARP